MERSFWVIAVYFVEIALIVGLTFYFSRKRRKQTVSSDGHVIPKSEDITCAGQYGHQHEDLENPAERYIVHEDPELGYVILNGVKRRITDCRDL